MYRTLSIIFPRSSNIIEKINKEISYPLEIYSSPNVEKEKAEIKKLKRLLLKKLENWKELTPIRGIIEDFFKVSKEAFGLGEYHKYTEKSISKNIYLCILLTAVIINNGFETKTKMQQLSEGNIKLKPVKQHRNKIKTNKKETKTQQKALNKNKQETLPFKVKERQPKLEEFIKF